MSSRGDQAYPRGPGRLPEEARAWLADHPEENPDELEETWRLAVQAPPVGASFEPDRDRITVMRSRLLREIGSQPPATDRTPAKILSIGRIWAVAASVLIIAAIGTIAWWPPSTVTVADGQRREIVLPDGSAVTLNSGSSLAYGMTFGWWKRSVTLEGEAFFEVTKWSDAFDVNTFNGKITVLGTQFNVRAWPKDTPSETEVILAEGSVQFSGRASPHASVTLHAGEMSRIVGEAGPTDPSAVDVDRLLVWRTGGLAFFDTAMDVVLADIQRRFGVVIVAPHDIRGRKVTLYLSEIQSAEEVLDVLAGMHGLQWTKQAEGYELTSVE